ncbi:MAG: hypothetical protein QM765_07375 [Myxococcales bacterium]
MIPMPPTMSETTAMAASSPVSVAMPDCCAEAISVKLRTAKSSSSRLWLWWRSARMEVICDWAR